MARLILSSIVSSSSASPAAPSAELTAEALLPPWLECASSMTIAKVLPRCSFPMSSMITGNF
jgi:hypothetical protein